MFGLRITLRTPVKSLHAYVSFLWFGHVWTPSGHAACTWNITRSHGPLQGLTLSAGTCLARLRTSARRPLPIPRPPGQPTTPASPHARRTRCAHAARTLHTRCSHAARTLHTRCSHAARTLHTRCSHAARTLHARCTTRTDAQGLDAGPSCAQSPPIQGIRWNQLSAFLVL